MTPSEATVRDASGRRAAADFTGHVRVAEMDRVGWNVVAADDFASEHLSRVVQSGSRVMPELGDTVGVVVTGPLTTRSPARAAAADEISRSFADVGARTDRDITRVMARDGSLQREDIDRLVQPTSLADLGRSSAQSVVAARADTAPAASSSSGGGGPALTVGSRSPFKTPDATRSDIDRFTATNIYRPGRTVSSGGAAGSGRTLVDPTSGRSGRPPAASGGVSSSGRALPSTSRPTVRGSSSLPSTRSYSTLPRTRSSSALPSSPSPSSPFVRQPVAPYTGGGRPGSSVSSSRPVIVPRTSPMRPSRSMGSGVPYAPSPSLRGAPSGRSSSGGSSVRAPSGSSAGSSGGRASSGSRSSAGSSASPRSSSSSGGSAGKTRPH